MPDNGQPASATGKQVQIGWESDEGKRSEFVNHATLVADASTVTLRFYQVLPPPGVMEDAVGKVLGRHVITLSISRGDIPAIAKLLNDFVEAGK